MNEEVVEIRERSSVPISAQHYRALEREPQFWALVDVGIVALERGRLSHYAIRAGPYVGQAVIGNIIVRIKEKLDGTLPSLLLFPEEPDIRILESESFADRSNLVIRALIDKFLDLLDSYLRYGRLKTYDKLIARSSLPRGKVSVARTMRRWASGRRDQVVYSQEHLSAQILINQLIGFALHLIDPIVRSKGQDVERRKRVRISALLFEDSNWQSLLFTPVAVIDRRFAASGYAASSLAGLASLARLFSLHFGAATTASEDRVKYSWFVNLETLFEECVRRSMSLAAQSRGVEVTDWRRDRMFIFPTEQKYRAEPDLVMWKHRQPIAVLDAKYKNIDVFPSNSDVYQLSAHAEAWNVRQTALVYPGATTSTRLLGITRSGAVVHSMTMDLLHLITSGAELLESLSETEGVQTFASAVRPGVSVEALQQ